MSPAPIRVLFIANRGEIARRIAATAERLGIVAVIPRVHASGATEPSRDFGTPTVDLLNAGAVVETALACGADAVHPGYGFLAESPALATAVVAAGLAWIGPPPDAIRALGDKARARDIARRAGVPVADGAEPADQSDASLRREARRIGLPLVVKPAAGGGGKGIRIVTDWGELPAALDAARREADRAFADERLILERFVAPARHVEVQVLADASGGVVHLGDRDCSLQRRHQKVLEEAPAPGLDGRVRDAIRAAAVRIATAVGYVGAGTCEFLVGDDGAWVFLEMNARLQVEHPVTELVLGRDLVADQIGIAEGRSLDELGIRQDAIDARCAAGGHAIEVRLNAEDPTSGFLPAAGRVVAVRWPSAATSFGPAGAAGIRVDAGIEPGDDVEARFDPLLAKIVAHATDREGALVRLSAALEETEVLGLLTNLAFLRRIVRIPEVVEHAIRTETLDRSPAARDAATGAAPIPEQAWGRAARLLLAAARGAGTRGHDWGPAWGDGWRLNLPATARLAADAPAGAIERTVALGAWRTLPRPSNGADPSTVGAPELGGGPAFVRADDGPEPFAALVGDVAYVSVAGRSTAFRLAPPPTLARITGGSAAGAAVATELVAPMPGIVVAVHADRGEAVEAGDPVVTLEAMKMEHVVLAPRAARVREMLVRAGDQVERGRVVARLEDSA